MSSANSIASCACKGIRTCLVCEPIKKNIVNNNSSLLPSTSPTVSEVTAYHYCPECKDRAWLSNDHGKHFENNSEGQESVTIKGVFVAENVISEEEEQFIINKIDSGKWVDSQSGRRKQDFGPKVNFKKKKVKIADFQGFPSYILDIFNRIKLQFSYSNYSKDVPIEDHLLQDFQPVELCHLEYEPSKGSSIDPHFDDDWLWGERLVTINYLSATYLTLSLPKDNEIDDKSKEIRIRMNQRSLLILSSDARYKWMHGIKRSDINERRLASTWREATPEFKPGGERYEKIGKELHETANKIIIHM